MKYALIISVAVVLAGCQPAQETKSEAPPSPPQAPAGPAAPEPPPAFVGTWAAEPSWCSNSIGPERPITVSETTFQGYENTCEITELQPTEAGWDATFACQAEGQASSHPVQIEANRERLEITWVSEGYDVEWRRCPT